MTATDELRRLLDERGIEWMPSVWSARDETFYKVGNTGFLATEMSGERMKVCIEGYVTPEQAVEATLGRGTCRMEPFVYEDTGAFIECSECGWQLFDADYSIDAAREWLGYCPYCGRKVVDA